MKVFKYIEFRMKYYFALHFKYCEKMSTCPENAMERDFEIQKYAKSASKYRGYGCFNLCGENINWQKILFS